MDNLTELDPIVEALKTVLDPHFQLSVLDMGMIRGINGDNGVWRVDLAYPCLACPAWDDIQDQICTRLMRLPQVSQVDVVVDWNAQWTKADISDSGKRWIRRRGYQL